MIDIHMTKHASIRSQQRNIPKIIRQWLIDFGQVGRHDKADVYYFNKKSRRQIIKEVGKTVCNRMNEYFDSYLVMADNGYIITAGRRHKKLKFN